MDDDGTTARANIDLSFKNETTGEVLVNNVTTNSTGQFNFDCANFINGYTDGDFVRILTNTSGSNGTQLRLRFISRGNTQINEIDCEYTIRS